MPTNYVTKVEGLEELLARLRGLPQDMQKRVLEPAVRKATVPLKERAIQMAPKVTGRLRAAIIMARDKKPELQHLAARYVVFVKYSGPAAAKYWRYVEFGTSKMAAAPFMRPAFITGASEATAIMIAEVAKGAAKY